MKVSKVAATSAHLEGQFEVEEVSSEELPSPSQVFEGVVHRTKGFSFVKSISVDELEESAKKRYSSDSD